MEKLKNVDKRRFQGLVVGYSWWHRVLKYIKFSNYKTVELENYSTGRIPSTSTEIKISSKNVAHMLKDAVRKVAGVQDRSQLDGSFLSIVSVNSKLKALTKPRPFSSGPEMIELINNLRPDLPAMISVERLEKVQLESEGEGKSEGGEYIEDEMKPEGSEFKGGYGPRGWFRGEYQRGKEGRGGENMDEPPNSRLFIIGGKTLTEVEFHEAFSPHGRVERVDMKRDKGISYIKFSKTSEAANALEALNGKTIGTNPRPLKIVIASSRGQQGTNKSDVTPLRLYLIVPRTLTKTQLRQEFETFGPLEYVSIIKDKVTNKSRGFAYVKYFQFSHAAHAFEGCDQSYRPKFADPQPSIEDQRTLGGSATSSEYRYGGGRGSGGNAPLSFNTNITNPNNSNRLTIMVNPILTQDKLWKLFDVVPGLQHCKIHSSHPTGKHAYGTVMYETPKAAAYALEKLHGFDYPLGSRVMIKFEDMAATANMPFYVKSLVSTIQHATQMLAQSGYVPPNATVEKMMGNRSESMLDPSMMSSYLASALLPGTVPMASLGTPCAEQLFFICKESREVPLPHIIKDLFSRFGNLIEAYLMKGKNYGYAKYATKESAQTAIRVLNEQTVMGCFLKVMVAEESSNKRPRKD